MVDTQYFCGWNCVFDMCSYMNPLEVENGKMASQKQDIVARTSIEI